jgi:hypothetical protein
MTTTDKFSIYQGQHCFILKGKKVANIIAYELFEVYGNGKVEPIEHILGYSDDKETYFEESFNSYTGWAEGRNPVKAVSQILTHIY